MKQTLPYIIHPNLANTASKMGAAMNAFSTGKAKAAANHVTIVQLVQNQYTKVLSELKLHVSKFSYRCTSTLKHKFANFYDKFELLDFLSWPI